MNAAATHPAAEVKIVASIVRATGDYAGSRIHTRACTGCAGLPKGWKETKTARAVDATTGETWAHPAEVAAAIDAPCVAA